MSTKRCRATWRNTGANLMAGANVLRPVIPGASTDVGPCILHSFADCSPDCSLALLKPDVTSTKATTKRILAIIHEEGCNLGYRRSCSSHIHTGSSSWRRSECYWRMTSPRNFMRNMRRSRTSGKLPILLPSTQTRNKHVQGSDQLHHKRSCTRTHFKAPQRCEKVLCRAFRCTPHNQNA